MRESLECGIGKTRRCTGRRLRGRWSVRGIVIRVHERWRKAGRKVRKRSLKKRKKGYRKEKKKMDNEKINRS